MGWGGGGVEVGVGWGGVGVGWCGGGAGWGWGRWGWGWGGCNATEMVWGEVVVMVSVVMLPSLFSGAKTSCSGKLRYCSI